jgi:hypothetical protein
MDLDWIANATGAQNIEIGARLQTLWGGYGEIRRVRLDGQATIVKVVSPPPLDNISHRRKLRSYDVELAWYRRYAASSPSRVPHLLAGIRRDDGWTFVFEDLDQAGYDGRRGNVDLCLAWLARFHMFFLGMTPEDLWPQGTYWHLATRSEELEAIADPALRRAAPIIDARLRESPFRTFVHGDAKVANFCFGAHDVAAVDFQYVGGGCAMSDVAYLICGDGDEEEKLDRYCHHLLNFGASPAIEREARAIYPFAAADFYRFFAGWAPHHWREEHHGRRVIRDILTRC